MDNMECSNSVDFSIEKENNTIFVEKTFSAPIERAWDAWTQAEELDQWWAPKPWKAITKSMDFRRGGSWLYRMEGPKGEQQWSKSTFQKIGTLKSFEATSTFCDENGIDNPAFSASYWKTSFKALENKTLVTVEITFDTSSDLDKMLEMGFKEGFIAGLCNLEEYFKR